MKMGLGVLQLLEFPDLDNAFGALVQEPQDLVVDTIDLLPVPLQVIGHDGIYFLPEDSRSKAGSFANVAVSGAGPSEYPTGSVEIFATIDQPIQ